jgi:hypothetical protein
MLFEAALRLYQQRLARKLLRTVVLLRLLRPALLLVRPVPQQVHLALLQLRELWYP